MQVSAKESKEKEKPVGKKKHSIVLKIDNPNGIDTKYNLDTSNLITNILPTNVTNINDLENIKKQTPYIPFIDETRKFAITLLSKNSVPNKVSCCFWDRHPFSTTPVGCPIAYYPNKIKKSFISDLTKERFTIEQNIPTHRTMTEPFTLMKNDYYEVDGLCCSFNCALAYMLEYHPNPQVYLLNKMYIDVFQSPVKIIPASHWRLLTPYGGHLSIEEFRNQFNHITFHNPEMDIQMKQVPKIKPIGYLYEEQYIF